MRTLHGRVSAISGAILVLCVANQLALGRSSQGGHDDPWNSEHIDRLPLEVRYAVIRLCADQPRADHYFATYLDNSHLIKLHFEHLHCAQQPIFCRGDTCLHYEYISIDGHYRLIKSYYGRNDD